MHFYPSRLQNTSPDPHCRSGLPFSDVLDQWCSLFWPCGLPLPCPACPSRVLHHPLWLCMCWSGPMLPQPDLTCQIRAPHTWTGLVLPCTSDLVHRAVLPRLQGSPQAWKYDSRVTIQSHWFPSAKFLTQVEPVGWITWVHGPDLAFRPGVE